MTDETQTPEETTPPEPSLYENLEAVAMDLAKTARAQIDDGLSGDDLDRAMEMVRTSSEAARACIEIKRDATARAMANHQRIVQQTRCVHDWGFHPTEGAICQKCGLNQPKPEIEKP